MQVYRFFKFFPALQADFPSCRFIEFTIFYLPAGLIGMISPLQVYKYQSIFFYTLYVFLYRFVKFCLLRFVNTRKSRLVCTIYVLSCYILKICTYYVCTSNFVNVYKINKENQFRNQNLKKCRIFNCL